MIGGPVSSQFSRWKYGVSFVLGLLIFGSEVCFADESDCVFSTRAVSSMESREIVFASTDKEVRVTVKLAETMRQRAAGMQHLCPEAIRRHPILFSFGETIKPGFHMHNVHAPLDILFLNRAGDVLEIQRMVPDGEMTFPEQSVRYALELLAGESARLGLHPGMRMQVPAH